MSGIYNFIMNTTFTHPKNNSQQRKFINQPYELLMIENQIHKFPESIRKSIRLNRHRPKPTLTIKNKTKLYLLKSQHQVDKLNINISICKAVKQDVTLDNPYHIPTIKHIQEYQNNTDRMFNMRRKLSPVKNSFRQDHRVALSVDSVRQKEVQQRTTFLNIEKLNLIKIFSTEQRNIESTRGQNLQQRYLNTSLFSTQKIEQKQQKQYDQKNIRDIVISLKKTLREGNSQKWPANNFKIKSKPFVQPFQRYYYRDFIWKVAFSNGILLQCIPEEMKLKVYVGRGNNSQLVRSLLKRRSWWTFTQKWQEANLIWTQLKINGYYNFQNNCKNKHMYELREQLTKEIIKRNQFNLKIMNDNDVLAWDKYWSKNRSIEDKISEDLSKRKNHLKKSEWITISPKTVRIQNHFPFNFVIGNKKALLYTMTQYYESIGEKVFNYLPLSYHIKKGIEDHQYSIFLKRFYDRKKESKKEGFNNVWIVKPGELTNRGNGIIVCMTIQEIKSILKRGGKHQDGTQKTFILQQYIEKPFLYQRRKFDLRHYMLATAINGRFKGYWFKRGYIRTSSAEYTLNHSQAFVHLTNDAVQKHLPDYGRYQKGNKLSYEDFQIYLNREYSTEGFDFFRDVYPKMKKIATDSLRASASTLDQNRKQHNFQLFGLDFMIDGQFKPWLIEINSNPCLQLSCPLLASIIPDLIQNTLKICVDSLICPPQDFSEKRPRFLDNVLINNEFELVYDSILQEGEQINNFRKKLDMTDLQKDEDEIFEDDGEEYDD